MTEATGRLLPELSEDNEFFWKSGEDGTLRFQRCTGCGDLRHPPSAVCPYCRSTEWEPAAVSGRGVVAGFTRNEQMWQPSFPPPYVIAIVAIEEDDRIRLTTNLVNCSPDDVFVGMKVQVRFEHDDDVWIPLFEPTGAADKGPFPAADAQMHDARPMPKGAEKFEDHVAITGLGISQRRPAAHARPPGARGRSRRARDRRRRPDPADIDGLSTYPGGCSAVACPRAASSRWRPCCALRPSWINGGIELPGQGGAVIAAMLAVAGGLCNHVLCFRTVWEATYAAQQRAASSGAPAAPSAIVPMGGARIGGDMQWRLPFGASSAANWIAMQASAHFDLYGTTAETLGWIALNARKNAALNPWAVYQDPLTMDDYLARAPSRHPSVSTTATCPATVRWRSSCRARTSPPTCGSRPST